ncbi:MAG: hypothetical protein HQ568_03645, partial [Calditrichaeota bacterium]|nr:hypothetical protein [Calditrichota bacterium]
MATGVDQQNGITIFERFFLQYIFVILLSVILYCGSLYSQPRYQQDDIVTWSDSRNARCVDISPDVVWVATDGGLWRFSRYTGQVLDPWYVGVGIHEAIPLNNSKIVLWHEGSNRLWVATDKELLYWRPVSKLWYRFESNHLINRRITSLGEMDDKIVVETDGQNRKFLIIDSFSGLVDGIEDLPEKEIRWQGRAGAQFSGFTHYYPNDFSLRFDSHDGSITDWDANVFKPVFEAFDRNTGTRYICYPGLGLVVVNEMQKRFDVLQLGPSGSDVKAIALSADGVIWLGGNNQSARTGFSSYNRNKGSWFRYESQLLQGFDSHNIRDAVIFKDIIFLATDNGLICYNQVEDRWKTLDRFDGLKSNNLSSLTVGDGFLLIGGDNGINRFTLPNGPMWQISYETAIGFNTYDLAADREYLWAAGQWGAFRIPVARTPEREIDVLHLDNEPAMALTIIDDKVWIATLSGIRAFDRKTGSTLVQLGYHGYLNCKNVLALAGNDKYLW